jgi:hypothetical protein
MSSTTRTGKEIDIEKKLQQYGIEIETEELPKELKQFIDNCIFAPPQLTTSPAAKKLRDDQPWAMSLNEASGKALLAPNLLFVGESMPGGIKGIKTQADVALYKRFLPQAPETLVEESFGPLAEPQPDTVVGYIPYGEAKKLGVTSFFTREEETVFLPYNSLCHLPHIIANLVAIGRLSTTISIFRSLPANGSPTRVLKAMRKLFCKELEMARRL